MSSRPKKVLITGAFGNLGMMCMEQALAQGYTVVGFDLDNPQNRRKSKRFTQAEIILGDIRNTAVLVPTLEKVDAIIHNASLLPPLTEQNPDLAQQINIDATNRLISAISKLDSPPVFIFPSSVTVFGYPQKPYPLKTTNDSVEATDEYTRHKLSVEWELKQPQNKRIPWAVLRVGVSIDSRTMKTDKATFKKLMSVKAGNPVEYVHPRDVALAMCNAIDAQDAIHKTLLIGGGASCQVDQQRFLGCAFKALGINLPETVYGENAFYTHWMDTTESQRILQFQQHRFEDYQQEMFDKLKVVRWGLKPFGRLPEYLARKILSF